MPNASLAGKWMWPGLSKMFRSGQDAGPNV